MTGGTFRDQEDAAGYFETLQQTALPHGLPLGVYSDRQGIFERGRHADTLAEQFTGQTARTQLGRFLEAAGIAWIAVRSPQARDRLERLWGTLQDRVVVELRLAGGEVGRGERGARRGPAPPQRALRDDNDLCPFPGHRRADAPSAPGAQVGRLTL